MVADYVRYLLLFYMKIFIFKKNNYLVVRCTSIDAFNAIEKKFAIHVENYQFMTAVKERRWDGKIPFFKDGRMKIGLLDELLRFCKQREIEYEIKFKVINKISKKKLREWIKTLKLAPHIKIRDYQFEIFYDTLKYYRITGQSETGSGKSLIIYLLFRFMLRNDLKTILIVPNIDLLYQMKKDFIEYGWKDVDAHLQIIGDKFKLKEFTKPLIISTWQSLYAKRVKLYNTIFRQEISYIQKNFSEDDIDANNKIVKLGLIKKITLDYLKKYDIDKVKKWLKRNKADFTVWRIDTMFRYINDFENLVTSEFNKIDVVVGDECDTCKADSLNHIIEKCKNAKFKVGLTGTMISAKFADWYTVVANFGKFKVYNEYAELRDRNLLSRIKIIIQVLKHSNEVKKDYHENILKGEYQKAVQYMSRLDKRNQHIADLVNSDPTKNWLLLFQFKQEEGQYYYRALKDKLKNKLYYIDGSVKGRDKILSELKRTKQNYVCLGSFKTMSRGINIPNLQRGVLLSSFRKWEKLIQTIGRFTRLFKDNVAIFYDFIDNMVMQDEAGNLKINLSVKHYYDRIEVYKFKKYDLEEENIDLF